MEEKITVKIQPLNKETFKPYGEVVEVHTTAYPRFEPVENMGRLAVQIFEPPRYSGEVDELANHFAYAQPVAAIKGSVLLVVAPPPERLPNMQKAEVDYAHLGAFEIKPGQGVCIGQGVWHYIGAMSESTLAIHMTRRDPAREFQDAFADFINVKKRDGRIIEVTH